MCTQVYSARTALVGCRALTAMWSHLDTEQLTMLREQLTELQNSGVVFPQDSWPSNLLRASPRHAPADWFLEETTHLLTQSVASGCQHSS